MSKKKVWIFSSLGGLCVVAALAVLAFCFQDDVKQFLHLDEYETSSISRSQFHLSAAALSGKVDKNSLLPEIPTTGLTKNTKMTITFGKKTLKYSQGGVRNGQKDINARPNTACSTWGGAQVQNCNDGKNTHFIGHNYGAFTIFVKAKVGQIIRVKDSKGKVRNYKIREVTKVYDDGYTVKGGKDYWDKITGTGGGERITIQTCLSPTTNLLVFAY